MTFGQAVEGIGHSGIGLGPQGRQIQIDLLQGSAAVVGAVVHIDHFQGLVEQINRRQDAVAVHATRVQIVGLEVGGGHKAHAVVEQGIEQAVQDHGVGDVGHMEFVKANQLVTLGNLLTQNIQGVGLALQLPQLAVHLAHELMKVQTGFALNWHRIKKAVHQKTLATPHPTVHVHTTRDGRTVDEFFQLVRTLFFVSCPFVGASLQRIDGT